MLGLNKKNAVRLEKRIETLEARCVSLWDIRDSLTDQNAELTSDNKKLRQAKQMDEEMIAHKLKMREEQIGIDCDKKVAAADRKADKRVADVKDEYRDKVEAKLTKRGDEMKEIQIEILNRLPDVSLAIKQQSKS